MQYKHSQIEPGSDQTNLERFFILCKISLGSNYYLWTKHPKLHNVLEYAHFHLYERTDPYKRDNGLLLQIRFLEQANQASFETKKKRNSYNDVLLTALRVGLINLTFCKTHLV